MPVTDKTGRTEPMDKDQKAGGKAQEISGHLIKFCSVPVYPNSDKTIT